MANVNIITIIMSRNPFAALVMEDDDEEGGVKAVVVPSASAPLKEVKAKTGGKASDGAKGQTTKAPLAANVGKGPAAANVIKAKASEAAPPAPKQKENGEL